jgi:hypothetical protein
MPMPTQILRRLAPLLLGAAVLAGAAGCRDEAPAAPAEAPAPRTVSEFFKVGIGGRTVRLQFAVLGAEMERGLMERRDLGKDDGMIFVYPRPGQQRFWMRDTPTPLDIGFFTPDGTLAEVYPMYPFDEKEVDSRRADLQFAVEMNQGWYAANGVREGARLDMAAVTAALRARGFDPKRFGL